jgi:hypothetical protein
MKLVVKIAQRLRNRIARAQHRVQRLMVKKANAIGLCLLSINMMVLIRENEKIAIANILPQARKQAHPLIDFAFLYLDLPTSDLASGFYKLQLSSDSTTPQALLVDLDNQPIGAARYFAIDIFASIVGAKHVPLQKLPIFETFHKTNETYLIGGTHADGQAFVVAWDL